MFSRTRKVLKGGVKIQGKVQKDLKSVVLECWDKEKETSALHNPRPHRTRAPEIGKITSLLLSSFPTPSPHSAPFVIYSKMSSCLLVYLMEESNEWYFTCKSPSIPHVFQTCAMSTLLYQIGFHAISNTNQLANWRRIIGRKLEAQWIQGRVSETRLGDHQWPRQTQRLGNGNGYSGLTEGTVRQNACEEKEESLSSRFKYPHLTKLVVTHPFLS